jgi:4-amino-4-deoxy-L-arabinose transferase-like glycosyltransferase
VNVKGLAALAALLGLVALAVVTMLRWLDLGSPEILAFVALVVLAGAISPYLVMNAASAVKRFLHHQAWKNEEGHFHSFGGLPLHIHDDGRHVWVHGADLQRVLGKKEPEEAQAACHSGAWRRGPKGELLLRVDAVVQVLNTMPGRDDPRILRLHRYFEREVLYPAEQRRRRSGT